MKQVFSFLFVAFLSTSIFAQTTWKADPAHTQVSFDIVHLGIAEIEGQFGEFEGSITASEDDFSNAEYEMEIDVASINTGVERRDGHLKSADFFDVENHPKMSFKSNSSEKIGDNKYKVTGDLTFHSVTKPVTLEVWHRGTVENPQSKNLTSGFAITGTIKRSDFNLGANFPEPMLSDEVNIEVDGEFIKQ
ncbi:YceI family protein [Salegentibacter agarivorans]